MTLSIPRYTVGSTSVGSVGIIGGGYFGNISPVVDLFLPCSVDVRVNSFTGDDVACRLNNSMPCRTLSQAMNLLTDTSITFVVHYEGPPTNGPDVVAESLLSTVGAGVTIIGSGPVLPIVLNCGASSCFSAFDNKKLTLTNLVVMNYTSIFASPVNPGVASLTITNCTFPSSLSLAMTSSALLLRLSSVRFTADTNVSLIAAGDSFEFDSCSFSSSSSASMLSVISTAKSNFISNARFDQPQIFFSFSGATIVSITDLSLLNVAASAANSAPISLANIGTLLISRLQVSNCSGVSAAAISLNTANLVTVNQSSFSDSWRSPAFVLVDVIEASLSRVNFNRNQNGIHLYVLCSAGFAALLTYFVLLPF
jgi:hypothetical protein